MCALTNTNRAARRTIGTLIAALALAGLFGAASASALSASPNALSHGAQVVGVEPAPVTTTFVVDPGQRLDTLIFVTPAAGSMSWHPHDCVNNTTAPKTCTSDFAFTASVSGSYSFTILVFECPLAAIGSCIPIPITFIGAAAQGPVATVTTLGAGHNPSLYGQNVTFGAHVAPSIGTGEVHGSVQFMVDGSPLGAPVALTPGGAAESPIASGLTAGTHQVDAVFITADAAHFNGSSASLNQVVDKAPTSLTAATTKSPSFVLKATVTALGSPVVGETVKFTTGSTTLCTAVTTSAGVASCSIPGNQQKINALLTTGRFTATFAATQNYTGASASSQLVEGGKL